MNRSQLNPGASPTSGLMGISLPHILRSFDKPRRYPETLNQFDPGVQKGIDKIHHQINEKEEDRQ